MQRPVTNFCSAVIMGEFFYRDVCARLAAEMGLGLKWRSRNFVLQACASACKQTYNRNNYICGFGSSSPLPYLCSLITSLLSKQKKQPLISFLYFNFSYIYFFTHWFHILPIESLFFVLPKKAKKERQTTLSHTPSNIFGHESNNI